MEIQNMTVKIKEETKKDLKVIATGGLGRIIYNETDMIDVYDGIFVKSFVMFFGESIQYYISEEYAGQVQVTESNRMVNNDVYNKHDDSRYTLLNQMLISYTLQEEEELYETMNRYAGLDEMTQKVFKLL